MKTSMFKREVLIISGLALMVTSPITASQGITARGVLEEIVVTSRKREEGLHDVPISVSVLSGDAIQEGNISDIASLAEVVPNFSYGESFNTGDRFVIRGLSTAGTGAGFEQAVGTNIDGIYYGRSRFGRFMFLDLERIEVLKGPQGALIGKNNTAGALNITTRKPGDEFGGYITGTWDFEDAGGLGFEGAVDIPFSDTLHGRIAGRFEDKEGWVEDAQNPGRDPVGGRDDATLRGLFVWDASDDITATLTLQYADLERDARTREQGGNCIPNFSGPPVTQDDCEVNNVRYQGNKYAGRLLDSGDEPGATELSVVGLTIDWDLNESWKLSSLTNFTEFDGEDLTAFQFNPASESWFGIQDNYEQFSQELRLTGSFNENLFFMGGIYYNDNTVEAAQIVSICGGMPAAMPVCTNAATDATWTGLQTNDQSEQNSETVSIFAQIDWELSEQWTLSLGGRYTDESKEAEGRRWLSDRVRYPGFELGEPLPGTDFAGGGGCRSLGGTLDGRRVVCFGPIFAGSNSGKFDRSENDFTPNIVLQWRPDEDHMFYASYAEGFKGGGYQLWPRTSGELTVEQIEYDPETAESFELGGKHRLASGLVQLNWAAFSTTVTDLQVSSFDPVLAVINITNAGKAKTQGLEADLQWALSENYRIGVVVAYTDGVYESYKGAACWPGQSSDLGCAVTDPGPPPVSSQDLSGAQMFAAPELQYSLSVDGTHPIGNSLELLWRASYNWKDDYIVGNTDNPITDVQDSYGKLDARLTLASSDGTWKASIIGRNLTDEITSNFGGNGNTARMREMGNPSLPNFPSFYFTSPGRQVAFQARWNF